MCAKVNRKTFSVSSLLWLIIAISMLFHISILIIGRTYLADWRAIEPEFHTAIEISGSIIALLVAMFLLHYQRFKRGSHYNNCIASALIAMGIIDGFHAVAEVGDTFVWLHSLATFIGGFLFISIYAPSYWNPFSTRRCWQSVIFISILICFLSVLYPEKIPAMTDINGFTQTAVTLNLIGGLFFLIASFKLVKTYKKHKSSDDLLFSMHCFLFGAAAIMFQQSYLWDAAWWGWHFLRFVAYATALWFIIRTEEKVFAQLDSHSQILKQTVENKTAELKQVNGNLQLMIEDMRQAQQLLITKEQQAIEAQITTQKSLDDLKLAKDSLVQAEKMASLGQLVAGVAHELNTPLGICVTANSSLKEKNQQLTQSLNSGQLSKTKLQSALEFQQHSTDIIENNLNSVSDLIQSFRSVAVEQNIDSRVEIDLYEHFNDIINMVSLLFRKKNYQITLNMQSSFKIYTYPGAWNQVITNLLMNSHIHGFENIEHGHITITVEKQQNQLLFDYQDDGCGISEKVKEKIFDPFVTTKRGQGSSGLGMHIVFNLVCGTLAGTVNNIETEQGCHFQISTPIH